MCVCVSKYVSPFMYVAAKSIRNLQGAFIHCRIIDTSVIFRYNDVIMLWRRIPTVDPSSANSLNITADFSSFNCSLFV